MICRYKSVFNAAQSADVMRYLIRHLMRHSMRYLIRHLATILIALATAPTWAGERDPILDQAKALGAPMAAIRRAIEISHQPIFDKRTCLQSSTFQSRRRRKDSTFWTSNQVKSPPITRHMANIMVPGKKPLNSKDSRRTWTWCRWARLRPNIP